ncbi:MAG: allantoicase [Acidobacteriota bacterium]
MTAAFLDLIDLASDRLGAAVVAANDEFFASKDNLITPGPPQWRQGEYTDRGKWMDGWETRRRREPGDDWCIVRLGAAGIVRGVDVETTHFKGNYPEACAIDIANLPAAGQRSGDELTAAPWTEILARTRLTGDAHNRFATDAATAATHVRLRIFPDGGVARLRVYGEVVPDWDRLGRRGEVDLAAAEHGGTVVACSDMFFGSRHNLIMPGDARNMGDGWETKRRRGPGHDWTVVRLGATGTIKRVEVDTRHYKGNAPGACSLEACRMAGAASDPVTGAGIEWRELLPRRPLQPHLRHTFDDEVQAIGAVTHVRFNIFPDGGVGRLRLFGQPG